MFWKSRSPRSCEEAVSDGWLLPRLLPELYGLRWAGSEFAGSVLAGSGLARPEFLNPRLAGAGLDISDHSVAGAAAPKPYPEALPALLPAFGAAENRPRHS